MKKWTFFMLLIAILLFGSVIGFNLFKQQKIAEYLANRPEPEFPVTVVTANPVDWVPVIEAIGFIEPNQGVTLTTETAGVIDQITFESGTQVAKDQPLVLLDSAVERANLKSTEARLLQRKPNMNATRVCSLKVLSLKSLMMKQKRATMRSPLILKA